MTNDDRLELLRDTVAELGSQAKVARLLGYSTATVSQVLAGLYKGALDAFLTRVEEVFGKTEVFCPVMGAIAYACELGRDKISTYVNLDRMTIRKDMCANVEEA